MPSDDTKKDDTPPVDTGATGTPEPDEPPLTGVLTEEDIREIEASGLTLGDVIRELELDIEAERRRV